MGKERGTAKKSVLPSAGGPAWTQMDIPTGKSFPSMQGGLMSFKQPSLGLSYTPPPNFQKQCFPPQHYSPFLRPPARRPVSSSWLYGQPGLWGITKQLVHTGL